MENNPFVMMNYLKRLSSIRPACASVTPLWSPLFLAGLLFSINQWIYKPAALHRPTHGLINSGGNTTVLASSNDGCLLTLDCTSLLPPLFISPSLSARLKEETMRFGFNGATTQTADLATDIRITGQAGYDVIKLRDDKLDQFLAQGSLDDVRQMLREAGVAAWTINAISLIGVGGTARTVARCHELSRYAQAIECPWVLGVPGPTGGRTDAQVMSDTVAALREMADAAAEFGVSIAFEFMGFPWAAVRDVAGAWAIVQEADRPNLGIVVDTAHFYAGGSTLDSIREVDPQRLVVLHINDVEDVAKPDITDGHRLYPGEGVVPLQDILGAVRVTGWDGVLSVELFREEYWQLDPLTVAREAKARTSAVWERILQHDGR